MPWCHEPRELWREEREEEAWTYQIHCSHFSLLKHATLFSFHFMYSLVGLGGSCIAWSSWSLHANLCITTPSSLEDIYLSAIYAYSNIDLCACLLNLGSQAGVGRLLLCAFSQVYQHTPLPP